MRDRLLRGALAALLEGIRYADQKNQISGVRFARHDLSGVALSEAG